MLHPDDPAMRVSHETIYQSLYVYPRGELRRELKACLRTGREVRRRRGRREIRGKITGAVPIGQRPPEAEGRLVPGHHEGDLVMSLHAIRRLVTLDAIEAHFAVAAREPEPLNITDAYPLAATID